MSHKKLAVIGHPIKHSLSPKIHHHWMDQHQIDGCYEAIDIDPSINPDNRDSFEAFLDNYFHHQNPHQKESGYWGVNITIPFKKRAFQWAKRTGVVFDTAVNDLGVINCLSWQKNGAVHAYNTDIFGCQKAYEKHLHFRMNEPYLHIILGTGGAAFAACHALLSFGVRADHILLLSRHDHNAEKILHTHGKKVTITIKAISSFFQNPPSLEQCMIINAWPYHANFRGFLNKFVRASSNKSNMSIFDLNYIETTRLGNYCHDRDILYQNGWDMFVQQAQKSFDIWFGIYPNMIESPETIM